MLAREKKSKKPLGASSASRWPREPVFFLDKCLGNYDVAEALRATGLSVELHRDHFDPDSPDEAWLAPVGKKGWVVLTKDSRFSANYLQIAALLHGNVRAFALRSAELKGASMASAFVTALPTIFNFLNRIEAPFIARVTEHGNVKMMWHKAEIYRKFLKKAP
ncbi:MAG TPA: hypothetical protein VGJ26_14145 [Pirellulales bacterium]|jgi:hypothetical protein